jgi:hypothetical protein
VQAAVTVGVRFSQEQDMAEIPTLQSEASRAPSVLKDQGEHNGGGIDPHGAWILLDEVSDDLVRAEAIVDLLGLEMQASRHQLYAAQIAGDFLRAASERISEARDLVRDIDLASRHQQADDT